MKRNRDEREGTLRCIKGLATPGSVGGAPGNLSKAAFGTALDFPSTLHSFHSSQSYAH